MMAIHVRILLLFLGLIAYCVVSSKSSALRRNTTRNIHRLKGKESTGENSINHPKLLPQESLVGEELISTSIYAHFEPCGKWDPEEEESAKILKYLNLTASEEKSRGGDGTRICKYKIQGMINGDGNCVKEKYCLLSKFGFLLAEKGIQQMTMSHIPGSGSEQWAAPLAKIFLNSSINVHSTNCSHLFPCPGGAQTVLNDLPHFSGSYILNNASVHVSIKRVNPTKIALRRQDSVSSDIWTNLGEKIQIFVDKISRYFTTCAYGLMCDLGNRVRVGSSWTEEYSKFRLELIQTLETLPPIYRWNGFDILRMASMNGLDCRVFSCPLLQPSLRDRGNRKN